MRKLFLLCLIAKFFTHLEKGIIPMAKPTQMEPTPMSHTLMASEIHAVLTKYLTEYGDVPIFVSDSTSEHLAVPCLSVYSTQATIDSSRKPKTIIVLANYTHEDVESHVQGHKERFKN